MKKILIATLALSLMCASCVKNPPYIEPPKSELQGVLFINEYNGTGQPYAGAEAGDPELMPISMSNCTI
ncbi:MAG: hypothetical protein LBN95_07750 [Prevotellaceae bacterium]|jgi:hypothetical protein|nr:hypothetical protein [Prevotellaceae bacterium]